MAGDADLVEQAVQLADDGGDLLGQVAGVHDCRAFHRLRRASIDHAPRTAGGEQASEECGFKLKPQSLDRGQQRAKPHQKRG
jgi:hypothetical protein